MNHVQIRAMERLGESIDIPEVKRIVKAIVQGEYKKLVQLGRDFGIYQVLLNNITEGVVIFDQQLNIIRTVGPKSWVKKKGNRYVFLGEKKKEDNQSKYIATKRDKRPYDRIKQRKKERDMLHKYEEIF